MSHTRLAGCLAAAMTVVFAVSGCSLISGAVSQLAGPSVPKVGSCWNTSNTNAVDWIDWEGSSAISCGKSHDLYTYEIGEISGVSAKSWSTSSDPDEPTTTVQAKAVAACKLSKLIPTLKWNQELIQGFFFIPSKSEWANGARWVRCDVGVLAIGTTLDAEALIKLPARISNLVSAVASDPKRYDYCVNTPDPGGGIGPLDIRDLNLVANCEDNPQWVLIGRGNLAEAVGSPFPVGAAESADTARICSKYTKTPDERWVAYLPQETSNAKVGTDREVDCWVGQTGSPTSGGVA